MLEGLFYKCSRGIWSISRKREGVSKVKKFPFQRIARIDGADKLDRVGRVAEHIEVSRTLVERARTFLAQDALVSDSADSTDSNRDCRSSFI